jgi:Domain of unknown function (DUF1998)
VSTGKIRRGQLVTPFGVGAMSVLVNGMSVVTAGLDHWYPQGDPTLDLSEYTEHDWRLEARLRVTEFRLPPDYRFRGDGNDPRNLRLKVPVLRFPRWHFCLYCKRLERVPLTMRTQVQCTDAKHKGDGKPRMSQVPFVAICAYGHLDDFPFDKWVHRSHSPSCKGTLRLESRGGGGLEGQVVTCTGCDRRRSLNGIMDSRRDAGGEEHTTLTDTLSSPDDPFGCPGSRPWLSQFEGGCGQPLRGALRAAGNVYFPKVESSIYLPRKEGAVSAEVHDLMRDPRVSPVLTMMHSMKGASATASDLRSFLPRELFAPISDDQLLAGYQDLTGAGAEQPADQPADGDDLTGSDEWRYPEHLVIRETPKDDYLSGTNPGIHPDLAGRFDRVRSIDVLRETRALRGFTRVRDDDLRLNVGKAMLRRKSLPPEHDWLPAYVVKGEGIYLELGASQLASWETRSEVQARADKLAAHYRDVASQRGLQDRALSPRFVLIHTLGHLLINELIFTCGYSSASLRERLYVSNAPGREMAGILIYTAAGDSEGTMGGLVRMSRPESLCQVIASALDDARWCSTDPVCMDAGEKGQGPDSCNLAACHGCALLPETSCEEFNRFLDRGLVIGTFNDPRLGFFSD